MASKSEIKTLIESAFEGVTLDGGISLNQTKVIDNYGRGVSDVEFAALPKREVTDNWAAIPEVVLDDADCVAFLDLKGFKYYIPALMLRLLDNYDPGSMMTIGTLSSLYPKTESREYDYSELTGPQRHAIAKYMQALPTLVDLWGENKTVVERAYRNYWSRYIELEK